MRRVAALLVLLAAACGSGPDCGKVADHWTSLDDATLSRDEARVRCRALTGEVKRCLLQARSAAAADDCVAAGLDSMSDRSRARAERVRVEERARAAEAEAHAEAAEAERAMAELDRLAVEEAALLAKLRAAADDEERARLHVELSEVARQKQAAERRLAQLRAAEP